MKVGWLGGGGRGRGDDITWDKEEDSCGAVGEGNRVRF